MTSAEARTAMTPAQIAPAQPEGMAFDGSISAQAGHIGDGDMATIVTPSGCIAMVAGAKPSPTRAKAKARTNAIARGR
jgi:hypothetical protein